MHYGHLHPNSHLTLDQEALGIDTHFTFSSDILTQARLWLQSVRKIFYREVVDRRRLPAKNPMSANQAFLLATRNGALALRRSDIGVLAPGAKADLLVWNGRAPSVLGWADPIAAIMLHANVGDIKHVMINGKFKKREAFIEGDTDASRRCKSAFWRVRREFKISGGRCHYQLQKVRRKMGCLSRSR